MIMAVEDEDDNAPEQDEDPDNAPAAGIYSPVLGAGLPQNRFFLKKAGPPAFFGFFWLFLKKAGFFWLFLVFFYFLPF